MTKMQKVKAVVIYGGDYVAPTGRGFHNEEDARQAAHAVNCHGELVERLLESNGALQSLWTILHAEGMLGKFQKQIDSILEGNCAVLAKNKGTT